MSGKMKMADARLQEPVVGLQPQHDLEESRPVAPSQDPCDDILKILVNFAKKPGVWTTVLLIAAAFFAGWFGRTRTSNDNDAMTLQGCYCLLPQAPLSRNLVRFQILSADVQ
jgi:hypothetical protein